MLIDLFLCSSTSSQFAASVRVGSVRATPVVDRTREGAVSKAHGEALEGLRSEALRNERKREMLRKRVQLLSVGSASSSIHYESLDPCDRVALAVSRKFHEVEGSLPSDVVTLYGRKVFAGIVAEINVKFWNETYFSVVAISSGTLLVTPLFMQWRATRTCILQSYVCSLLDCTERSILWQPITLYRCTSTAALSVFESRDSLHQRQLPVAQWHGAERLPRGDCSEALFQAAAFRAARRARER